MLTQIHHQFKDGTTEMCSQKEVTSHAELIKFAEETKASHPLPEGAEWLIVTEPSSLFWKTKREA